MIAEKAKVHAINAHKVVCHKYDNHEYEHHLDMTDLIGKKFIYLIPEKDRSDVFGGIWEHDTIEDCGLTLNDVVKATNKRVGELAYACTNEKGRTRAERANNKYYRGIRNTEYATFVKLCDRIANVTYSLNSKNRMFEMYRKENTHFRRKLEPWYLKYVRIFGVKGKYDDMWNYLDELLKVK